ncbi:Protein of unknown function [Pyronema omphalodes CBS 100304]|uniref:Uncharacterized protein n=1 Tax=Pyronema omphalodes (strain CBS 100304) TaxID=1076935 RepID=U4LH08_PYROM|nr:Protein of unknown function [Pyronema omphalodes CBS 100304]
MVDQCIFKSPNPSLLPIEKHHALTFSFGS